MAGDAAMADWAKMAEDGAELVRGCAMVANTGREIEPGINASRHRIKSQARNRAYCGTEMSKLSSSSANIAALA